MIPQLSAYVVAISLGVITAAATAQDQTPPTRSEDAARTLTVVVRVLDGRGKPVEGAGLIAGFRDDLLVTDALERPLARSAKDGRLRVPISLPRASDSVWSPALLLAAKGKVAIAVGDRSILSSDSDVTELELGDVVLFDAVTVRGQVVDDAGKPLAGARVAARDGIQSECFPMGGPTPALIPACLSAVVTDDRGLFVLPCVADRGLDLSFAKAGYYQRRMFPVGRETPLKVELLPSGFISGRALDTDGRGVATTLSITYECGSSGFVRSLRDGSFRATVAQPGRYRLRNLPRPDRGVPELLSPVLEGPQKDVELRPSSARADTVTVVVRAVDEQSGKEVESFTAKGLWDERTETPEGSFVAHHSSSPLASDGSRRVRLAPMGRSGHVVVVAGGYAPAQAPLELDAKETTTELTVKLGPEALIAGQVVDESGKGIAGVRVWAVAVQPNRSLSYGLVPDGAVQSGADGGFRIGSLAEGQYVVQALHDDRQVPKAAPAETAPGKPPDRILIEMRAGLTLRGKLTGRSIDPRCYVRLEDTRGNVIRASEVAAGLARYNGRPMTHVRRIAGDGTFCFERLEAGRYRLVLVQPTFERLAPPLEFRVTEFELATEKTQDFDIAACMPGRLEGSVDLGGADIPSDRLIVIVKPHFKRKLDRLGAPNTATAAAVDMNRHFALDLAPGSYELRVIDVASAVTLEERNEPVTIVAGSKATAALSVRAARVRVKLVPGSGGPMRVSSLVVTRTQTGQDPHPTYLAGLLPAWDRGIPLEPGQTELDLCLPEAEFTLKVWSLAGCLTTGNVFRTSELANETFSAPGKGSVEVKLTVAPPPATAELDK